MPRTGFIHDKLDIKLLVLYLTARTLAPVGLNTLTDLAMCDDGVDYFLFTQALAELVESGHLQLAGGRYAITDKGRKNGAVCEADLPFSVRRKCDDKLAALNAELRRLAQVRCQTLPRQGGGFTVCFGLDDGEGSLLSAQLYAPTREQAERMAAAFSARPDRVYRALLSALQDEAGAED